MLGVTEETRSLETARMLTIDDYGKKAHLTAARSGCCNAAFFQVGRAFVETARGTCWRNGTASHAQSRDFQLYASEFDGIEVIRRL